MKKIYCLTLITVLGFSVQGLAQGGAAPAVPGKGAAPTASKTAGKAEPGKNEKDARAKEEARAGKTKEKSEAEKLAEREAGRGTKPKTNPEANLDKLGEKITTLRILESSVVFRERLVNNDKVGDLVKRFNELVDSAKSSPDKSGVAENELNRFVEESLLLIEKIPQKDMGTSVDKDGKVVQNLGNQLTMALHKMAKESVDKGYTKDLADVAAKTRENLETMDLKAALDKAVREVTKGRAGWEEFIKCVLGL